MSDRPCLITSVPTALSYRNVVFSGLAKRLATGNRLIIASSQGAKQYWNTSGLPISEFWDLKASRPSRRHELVFGSLRHAFFDRYGVNTRDMINRYRHRDKASSLRKRFRDQFYRSLSPLGKTGAGWRMLQKQEERAFHAAIPSDTARRIQESGINAGFSTVCKLDWEWPLFRTLQHLGIPTVTHILSFDNLTSVGFLPIQGFDRYLCWSEWLAQQLQEFYEIPRERIEVTGTPQFDFHLEPRFRWDRKKTHDELRVDYARPYILYCANLRIQTPREPELVAHLVNAFAEVPALRDYQWVIRFHPSDEYGRWHELEREFGAKVRFSQPWPHLNDGRLHWGVVEQHGVELLSNSIRHASCVLSMGSTLALDCAVLDKPIVNVGFHPDRGSIEDRYYANAHQTFHYAPITQSDAAPVAGDLDELIALVGEAINDAPTRSHQRRKLRDTICGPVDGHAAERIFDTIDRLISPSGPVASTGVTKCEADHLNDPLLSCR